MKNCTTSTHTNPAKPGDFVKIKFAMHQALVALDDAERNIKNLAKPSDDYVAALKRLDAARKALIQ